jgi:hypothetical protein
MSGFNTIKKSRKRSHEIEEKLNVLNRELEKTKDIQEQPTMSTGDLYTPVVATLPQDPVQVDNPDPDPSTGATTDNWTQPVGDGEDGGTAGSVPDSFPFIVTNPGYQDPTSGWYGANGEPLYSEDDLEYDIPDASETGGLAALGGVQREKGGTDPGVINGYLRRDVAKDNFVDVGNTGATINGVNFKTHPHLFKPINYWVSFSIFNPFIESFFPNNPQNQSPQYTGVVAGSVDNNPRALFTAYKYVGGARTQTFDPVGSRGTTTAGDSKGTGDADQYPPIPWFERLGREAFEYLKDLAKSPFPLLEPILDLLAKMTGTSAEKDNVDDYTRNFIPDLAAGKEPTGSTPDNPRDNSDIYDDETISDYEEIYKDYQKEKNGEKGPLDNSWQTNYDLKQRDNNSIGNTTGTLDSSAGDGFIDNGDGTETLRKAFDFDRYNDMAGSNVATTLGAMVYGIMSGIPGLLIKSGGKTPTMYTGITFDKKTGKVIKGGVKESYQYSKHLIKENAYMALLDRTYKPTERDYVKYAMDTPDGRKQFDKDIKMVHEFIKKNPDKYEYVLKRYPKDDPRLSMLNYRMDRMMEASDKYLETQFPTNQTLFTKVKERTKKNMNLTDPKNFKPVKDPIKYVDVKKTKKLKETVTRHFNKPVKSKSMFGLNMGKVRKTNQKMIEKREQEQRIKEEDKAYIEERMSRQKSNWKDDLTTL